MVATVSEPEQPEWQAHAPPQQQMSDVPAEVTQVRRSPGSSHTLPLLRDELAGTNTSCADQHQNG